MMDDNHQVVVTAVMQYLKGTDQTIADAVVRRLVSFGYTPDEADAWAIAFSIDKVVNHVLTQTNLEQLPVELTEVVVDMSCGEFLAGKSMSGQLQLSSLDLSGAVESIKEGDTTVTFAKGSSDKATANDLIDWLRTGKGCDFLCFRRMRW